MKIFAHSIAAALFLLSSCTVEVAGPSRVDFVIGCNTTINCLTTASIECAVLNYSEESCVDIVSICQRAQQLEADELCNLNIGDLCQG